VLGDGLLVLFFSLSSVLRSKSTSRVAKALLSLRLCLDVTVSPSESDEECRLFLLPLEAVLDTLLGLVKS